MQIMGEGLVIAKYSAASRTFSEMKSTRIRGNVAYTYKKGKTVYETIGIVGTGLSVFCQRRARGTIFVF
jgi:hypothetical protein